MTWENKQVGGKKRVSYIHTPHKFCWFLGKTMEKKRIISSSIFNLKRLEKECQSFHKITQNMLKCWSSHRCWLEPSTKQMCASPCLDRGASPCHTLLNMCAFCVSFQTTAISYFVFVPFSIQFAFMFLHFATDFLYVCFLTACILCLTF